MHQTGALCWPDLVQVAVGAEPRAAGSAGRELGEPRLGLVERQEESLGHQRLGVRGGGNLQSVGGQLVKGVVLVHQTSSPASAKSCCEVDCSQSFRALEFSQTAFMSCILASSSFAQDIGLSSWFYVGHLVPDLTQII